MGGRSGKWLLFLPSDFKMEVESRLCLTLFVFCNCFYLSNVGVCFFYLWACAKHGWGGGVEEGLKGQGATEEGDRQCLAGEDGFLSLPLFCLFISIVRPSLQEKVLPPHTHNCVQDPRCGVKACLQGVICVLNMQSKGLIWSRKGVRVGGRGSSELTPDLPASTRSDSLRFSQNTTSSPSRFVCFHT